MNRETRLRAAALENEPLYKDAAEYLKARAVQELLAATTPEDREEKWLAYHALGSVMKQVGIWAAEAKTQD